MTDKERIYTDKLKKLSPTGRNCEICDQPMQRHAWVDMDENGFAVNCSNKRIS